MDNYKKVNGYKKANRYKSSLIAIIFKSYIVKK